MGITRELRTVYDQMGERVIVPRSPERIISLVPSQTELLSDLLLDQEVKGITKFCIHPGAWLKTKTIIGGTKNFMFDRIDALQPDLIIGNKEENYQEGIVTLKKKYPVWMSDIVTFDDALTMINSVGDITDRSSHSTKIINQIQESFSTLKRFNTQSVLYLIWKKPWMAAGEDTFINTLLEKIGLTNSLKAHVRYPELSDEQIAAVKPDLIFLSSEPYPFKEQHIEELKRISPSSTIELVDGEMFSWYGSRLIKAPAYFNSIINR